MRRQLWLIAETVGLLIFAVSIEKTQSLATWQLLLVYLVPYLIIGAGTLKEAAEGLLEGDPFNEHFLMAIATIGALCIGFLPGAETEFPEAVFVMLFFQVGELFEGYAEGKSRESISHLMDIRPDVAHIEVGDEKAGIKEVTVSPDEVTIGSTIVVRPGEKVPLDGVVISGASSLNTMALTGESVPREVGEEDEVISGCININGVLRIRTTKSFGESTVSKIIRLVEDAGEHKSQSETFITRFARIYTPAVVFAALALALLPPLVRVLFLGLPGDWHVWVYRALTFLVISCPCALVISIPLSFFAGIGGASHEGILIKGSNYLEALSQVRTLVFDKTGTLTRGVFEVSGIHHSPLEDAELLELAALAECASSHPVGKSLRSAYGKEIDRDRVRDVEEIGGHGITAVVDGKRVAVGNEKLMSRMGIPCRECHSVGTIVHVAVDGAYAGHFVISDLEKSGTREAVPALRRAGIEKIVMLTGDGEAVAADVAQRLGLDEYHSGLLPGDKVQLVEEMMAQEKRRGVRLAFVGDGINDAPVLARADVGIAMGALGSDAAIEAADIVLMDDDPKKIVKGIRISRKCIRIVYENIVFALAVKFGCLILGAFGLANMWAAIFADVGVMVLAVLNAIRALQVRDPETASGQ